MDFWRSEAYMKYFEFLENKGGFYYEVRHCTYPSLFMRFTTVTISVGEMRPSTASLYHCSLARIKFTSSKTLDTDTVHSNTVRRDQIGREGIVLVILMITLV